jgi:hypothetical protein
VILSWTASVPSSQPESSAIGYCLYRGEKANVALDNVAGKKAKKKAKKTFACKRCEQVNFSSFAGTTCVDNLVSDGATYYYVAVAINRGGISSNASNEIRARIPDGPSNFTTNKSAPPLCREPSPVR